MCTLLKRLQAKGLITRKKAPVGKAFDYSPTGSAGPTCRRILHDIAQRIFGGNGVEMVSALYDMAPPTPKELDRLQKLLDDLRAKQQSEEQ